MFYLPPDSSREPELGRCDPEVPDWSARFEALHKAAKDVRLQAFYRAGVVDGTTPIQDIPLLAIDFETTGFDPQKHEIISIGLVPMSVRRIRCAGARQWVFKPRGPLPSESVVVHGLTHSDLALAPDLNSAIEPLLQAMAGHIMVVHHRGIERNFLDAALRKRIGEGIDFPVIDTMELEARIHRQKPLSLLSRLLGKRPPSIRLADSRTRYHLPFYKPHDALTDALATAELLQAQISDRYTPETPVCELWK